jgi:hypothetical protein
MIARNKQPVRIGSGLNIRACGQNRRKHDRLHDSYRALLRGWAFRPWQKATGYNLRAKVEASIGRYKRVIGDALRSRTDQTEATEVALAGAALNRMLGLGRPNCVRIA